jgi:DeoR family transcriptional regulator, suf operon transcriptional repressor
MKSTRDRILQTLLSHPKATISDLAEAVQINTISVRHHLTNLQLDGLIKAEEERHGVGRPRLVYSLTSEGQEKFPSRYLQLTDQLLTQLKQVMSESQFNNLFPQIAKQLAGEKAEQTRKMPFEKKLEFLKNVLEEQGFSIEWEKSGDDYRINEVSCPFYHIGQSHPEVCTLDQTLISSILSIPIEKVECVLDGDHHCTYLVSKQKTVEA